MECPVCLKSLKKKQCINPCEHKLCSSCFKKIANKRCPLCRCKMLSLQTIPSYDARLFSTKYIMVKTTKKDKIISLTKLKSHIFSMDFKNYLTDVLTRPHMYVIKRIIFCIELPNVMRTYSPENLHLYTLKELFYMYEANIHRFFQFNPNVINYLTMKIKEEIERRTQYSVIQPKFLSQ